MTSKKLESKVDKFEERIEKGIQAWVKNDQFFNGFRNTPARILLFALTIGVLYGLGAYAFIQEDAPSMWTYIVCLGIISLMQKLSVRFVFDDDAIIDEYQKERRDKAFRRAYKRIAQILSLVIAAVIVRGFAVLNIYNQDQFWPFPNGTFHLYLSTPRVFLGLVFVDSLSDLQKYVSWGCKGEPWRDTARK